MSYRTTGPRDSAQEIEVKADWAQGVNTILPKDRLGPMQLHHLMNGTLRKGYPETRPGAPKAPWLYNADGTVLAERFQAVGLAQSSNPDPRARLPVATLVIGDNNLWLCAPNNVPHLLKAGITDDLQPCQIIDAFDYVLILRNLLQAPVRYKYVAGGVVEALPAPRETMTALPPAAVGCYAANRIWLKFGKSEVIASDLLEWDYRPLETRYLVDDGEGDEILRLWPAGENRIIVFKERSVHVIDGIAALDTASDPPVQVNIYRVAAARGCVSPDAIVQRGQAVLYLSSEGIEVLNLSAAAVSLQQDVPISGAAQRYFDEVRWRAVRGAQMAISSNYLMLAVPTRWGERDYLLSLPGGQFPEDPNSDPTYETLTIGFNVSWNVLVEAVPVLVNYIEVPFFQENWHDSLLSGSWIRTVSRFRGLVRLWASGTVEFIGEVTTTDPTTARDHLVATGTVAGAKTYRVTGTAPVSAVYPAFGDWQAVNWSYKLTAGEVLCLVAMFTTEGALSIDALEYPTGWKLPLTQNATGGGVFLLGSVDRVGNNLVSTVSFDDGSFFTGTGQVVSYTMDVSDWSRASQVIHASGDQNNPSWAGSPFSKAIPDSPTNGAIFDHGAAVGTGTSTTSTKAMFGPIFRTAYSTPTIQQGIDPIP